MVHRHHIRNLENEFMVAMVTTGSREEAEKIATALVKLRLAACCNIIEGITSIYEWQGKIENGTECLIIAKTRKELFEELAAEVRQRHSYEVPEIIGLPLQDGFQPYFDWVSQNTRFGTGQVEI